MHQSRNWSDDDALWESMLPALASAARFASAENDVEVILRSIPLPPSASVLDLGCGAGVHAVAFARRAFAVTGLDRTPTLLRRAHEEAAARSLSIELVHADMRDFVRRDAFDLVCSLNASFGYFDDDANAAVLRNVHTSLRRGGTFVLEVLSREIVDSWPREGSYDIDGKRYAVERRIDGDHLAETWTVDGQRFTPSQRLYAPEEIEPLLRDAAFDSVRIADGFDRRLIAFAAK